MKDLEMLLIEFYMLAKRNPDSVFHIYPGDTDQGWIAGYTKFGYWWLWEGEGESSTDKLRDVLKATIDNFPKVTQATADRKKAEADIQDSSYGKEWIMDEKTERLSARKILDVYFGKLRS